MATLKWKLGYALWTLNGYIGRKLSLNIPQKVTVLITDYHPTRMRHIEPQVRNILKCDFVDRIIISNHNPDIKIESKVKINDKRLVLLNHEASRGCGYPLLLQAGREAPHFNADSI